MNIENIQYNIIKNNLTDMFNDFVAKKVRQAFGFNTVVISLEQRMCDRAE